MQRIEKLYFVQSWIVLEMYREKTGLEKERDYGMSQSTIKRENVFNEVFE